MVWTRIALAERQISAARRKENVWFIDATEGFIDENGNLISTGYVVGSTIAYAPSDDPQIAAIIDRSLPVLFD